MPNEVPPLIMAIWVDTQTHGGWHDDPNALGPCIVLSAGYLISEDDRFLKVAGSWTKVNFADLTVIPKGNIVYREDIKMKRAEKWLNDDTEEKDD